MVTGKTESMDAISTGFQKGKPRGGAWTLACAVLHPSKGGTHGLHHLWAKGERARKTQEG